MSKGNQEHSVSMKLFSATFFGCLTVLPKLTVKHHDDPRSLAHN